MSAYICFVIILAVSLQTVSGFAVHPVVSPIIKSPTLYASNTGKPAKGFGKKQDPNLLPDVQKFDPGSEPAIHSSSSSLETKQSAHASSPLSSNPNEPLDIDQAIKDSQLIKRIKAEKIATLKQKIQALKEEEELISSDPSVGAVPEIVANRMINRIAAFFGIPVFGGLAVFASAIYVSKTTDFVVPPTIIAYATQFPFIIGLLGITYAILSSSWDEVGVFLRVTIHHIPTS